MKKTVYWLFLSLFLVLIGCSEDENVKTSSVEFVWENFENLQDSIHLGYEGGEEILEFTINAEWEVSFSSEDDWCVVSPLQGDAGKNSIRIIVSPNTTEERRIMKLFFNVNGHLVEELSVIQLAKEKYTPSYVAIDWDKTKLLDCNPESGTFSLQFEDEKNIPDLSVGSAIVIDADTTGYIAIIKQLAQDKNVINVQTQQGSLCDIFSDTEIILSTNENITRSMGNVYYPVEIIYQNERGEKYALSRTNTSITGSLWNWGKDFEGTQLYSAKGFEIYLSEANLNVSIDLEMVLNFGGSNKVEMIMDGIHRYKSEALSVSTNIVGTVSSALEVTLEANASTGYEDYGPWIPNIFTPIRVKFLVGSVPVWITLSADLYKGCFFQAEGELTAKVGCSEKAQGRLGVKWEQSSEELVPVKEFSNVFEVTPPVVEGKGNINAKACVAPRIFISLYDVVGPSFDLKPYVSSDFSGGFKEELLSSSNDYCAWSLVCDAGVDADAGLSFTFLNFEPKEYTLSQILDGDLNLFNKQLYESPVSISLASGNQTKITAGELIKVSFNVYDNNYLLENPEILTPLPQIVKFEGSGDIKSKYGIVKDGLVVAEWTPKSSSDTLFARLYNTDGAIIAESKFYGEAPIAITGDVSNITETSASVVCSYENMPLNAEYGIVLVVDDTSKELKYVSDGKDGERIFQLQDLKSGVTYSYYAYIRYNDKVYKGKVVSFETKKKIEITEGQAIDLGLSVKWAAWNIGASKPEELGNYYAWGEIEPKTEYTYKTYKYWEDLDGSGDNILADCGGGDCADLQEYVYIGNNISGTQYDVARVKWGDDWHLPTRENVYELIQKCTFEWIVYKGVNGMMVTGPNGNSIFLPAGGYKGEYVIGSPSDSGGYYWTGSLYEDKVDNAHGIDFQKGYLYVMANGKFRYQGLLVRPVTD